MACYQQLGLAAWRAGGASATQAASFSGFLPSMGIFCRASGGLLDLTCRNSTVLLSSTHACCYPCATVKSIFTKIICGEVAGHFIYEDQDSIAIMAMKPICEGHVLLAPREPVEQWDDLPMPLGTHLLAVGQRVAKALKRVYGVRRVGVMIAGIETPHTHLHLFPAADLTVFSFQGAQECATEVLAAVAEPIRNALLAAED